MENKNKTAPENQEQLSIKVKKLQRVIAVILILQSINIITDFIYTSKRIEYQKEILEQVNDIKSSIYNYSEIS